MEFPARAELVSDNSEPENHPQEKASDFESCNAEVFDSNAFCEESSLSETVFEAKNSSLSDPEADLKVLELKESSDSCELPASFSREILFSNSETDNLGAPDSSLSSSALSEASISASTSHSDSTHTSSAVLEVSASTDKPTNLKLEFSVPENAVKGDDAPAGEYLPVNSDELSDALSCERMIPVSSDDQGIEEMPPTGDVESDYVSDSVEVAVGIDEQSTVFTDCTEAAPLSTNDIELDAANNSPSADGEEKFCSPKSLGSECGPNGACGGEEVFFNASKEVEMDSATNSFPSNTLENENTSITNSSFNSLIPLPTNSPPILNDALTPMLCPSSVLLSPSSKSGDSVTALSPAEWCEHCGVVAATDATCPNQFLPNDNCIENGRNVLEHLPSCRYYEEPASVTHSEATLDPATPFVPECRSNTDSNSETKTLCSFHESDDDLNLAAMKSCAGSDVAEDEIASAILSSEHSGEIGNDALSEEVCVTEMESSATDAEDSEKSGIDEGEVFAIDDLGAPAEASISSVHSSPEETASDAQNPEDLPDSFEVSLDGETSEMKTVSTQNASHNEQSVPNEADSACAASEVQEKQPVVIDDMDVSCDPNNGLKNSDCKIGAEAFQGNVSLSKTPTESLLDNDEAVCNKLELESPTNEPDEDDFEESLPENSVSLLPDNSHSLSYSLASSVRSSAPSSASNSLSDFSSTKCILKDSDSCGPSPEPTDGIDISCGISVLFEKCKNRRDLGTLSCSSSKVDKTTRSMVATSENISSQIERLSIAESSSQGSATAEPGDRSEKSGLGQDNSAQNLLTNMTEEGDVPTSDVLLSPERKLGVLLSPRNCPILEETDDEVRQSSIKTENPAKSLLFKLSNDKAQSFKNPCTEHVVTTSAPCSPVPQPHRASSMAGIASRKRKSNNCVRRRVSFPENDMLLITSYLEPVDPWERMKRSVNSDEVLRAYMTSCRNHGCQPMPIVTNQIAALPLNVPGRVECFSLRGCKLELSQCEGLEEIFKRVQFVCIDLENCSLSDDTVIPLLDMIEFYDSTTHLNISGNSNIGIRGWQACSRMLKKNQSVRSLNARGTNLNEVNMPILGKALKLGSRLHTLHLESCNLTGRPLIMLTAALKLNDTVVKLYLADNRLGSNDCIQIGNLMKTNLTIKLLDLRNNNLQDVGCAHVCEGIAEQNKSKLSLEADSGADKHDMKKWGLNSLVLWNNHMTVSSAKHLASMMLASTSIETLNVGRNSVSNDGAIRLKEALLRNKSLKRLYLHATKIGDEGAVALAELLAESKNIERVDLRENSIKVAGLMALAHSLRHNTSMVQMDLDSNPRLEPLEELAEKHVSLLLEIKEYTQRNRAEAQAHPSATDSKEADSEDYYLDPDFRKLSLSSEIDGSQTLEIPTASAPPNRVVSIALGSGSGSSEEHKRYRSPSPSPCASPVPSPSLSPVPPTPFKNRFKVFKVSSASSPAGSCIVTANPIYSGNGASALSSTAFPLSSSAPSSSLPTPIISTTSRPVVHHPSPVGRNRFLSGGRFTVTKVSDTSMHQSSSIMKSKSLSLPQIPLIETVKETEPSSPKIVISSPAKIERGFSLEENPAEGKPPPTSVVSTQTCASHCTASAAQIRTDSSESDDVFVDSSFSQSDGSSSVTLRADKNTTEAAVSPVTRSRRDLTDSGFLEETNADFEDPVPSLPVGPTRDSDRDSLFSNTSDGHSPVTPLPSTETSPVPASLQEALPITSTVNTQSSNSGEFLSSLPSRLGALFRGTDRNASSNSKLPPTSVSENKPSDRSPSSISEVTSQPKRAPLAAMENGSMDTDSEDSEVATQSSDSTHSDEVRITSMETGVEPVQAWGGGETEVHPGSDGETESSKKPNPSTCGAEELVFADENTKTQPEFNNKSEVHELLTEAGDAVEPLVTDP